MARHSARILTHDRFKRVPPANPHYRELVAVRDILHAVITADDPGNVFQFALDRVSALVGASFSSIYLVDGASELMKLAAAHNWPARYRPWLAGMRVRLGFGPSGEAAAERRIIEVPDVAADAALEDWAEVAGELGFRSLVSLPLQAPQGVLGAVTFYFAEEGRPTDEKRSLMRIVADQIAGAARTAQLAEDLRRANAALADANQELERQYSNLRSASRGREAFLSSVTRELREPVDAIVSEVGALSGRADDGAPDRRALEAISHAALRLEASVSELLDLAALQRGDAGVQLDEFDPGAPLHEAVEVARARWPLVRFDVDPGTALPPVVRSDRGLTARALVALLRAASAIAASGGGSVDSGARVTTGYAVSGGRVTWRVEAVVEGARAPADPGDGGASESVGVAFARGVAGLLGGAVSVDRSLTGAVLALELPLEYDPLP